MYPLIINNTILYKPTLLTTIQNDDMCKSHCSDVPELRGYLNYLKSLKYIIILWHNGTELHRRVILSPGITLYKYTICMHNEENRIFFHYISSLGLMKSAVNANSRNTNPPITVTVLTEIFCAIILPPNTANPVQNTWPSTPPTMTP